MLSLPRGYGVEDILGWVREQSLAAMLELWRVYGVAWAAYAYRLIDSLLFVPRVPLSRSGGACSSFWTRICGERGRNRERAGQAIGLPRFCP